MMEQRKRQRKEFPFDISLVTTACGVQRGLCSSHHPSLTAITVTGKAIKTRGVSCSTKHCLITQLGSDRSKGEENSLFGAFFVNQGVIQSLHAHRVFSPRRN